MIDLAKLLEQPIKGNYFAAEAYIQGDFESGLLENRQGSRLLALPSTLLQAIYAALDEETGQATPAVLFRCGRWWGKNFYRRFASEISAYYGKPLAELEMAEFIPSLQQCWQTHGWGKLTLNWNYYDRGFVVVSLGNSAFAQTAPPQNRPVCYVEAGILSVFFSQLAGRELHCVQTACESLGAAENCFIVGLAARLQAAEAWVEEGHDHETILERLCPQSH